MRVKLSQINGNGDSLNRFELQTKLGFHVWIGGVWFLVLFLWDSLCFGTNFVLSLCSSANLGLNKLGLSLSFYFKVLLLFNSCVYIYDWCVYVLWLCVWVVRISGFIFNWMPLFLLYYASVHSIIFTLSPCPVSLFLSIFGGFTFCFPYLFDCEFKQLKFGDYVHQLFILDRLYISVWERMEISYESNFLFFIIIFDWLSLLWFLFVVICVLCMSMSEKLA